jgi:hypothetical protein
VGKIRTPVGLFNEFRDVGTLLALYRPLVSVHGEQVYANETVSGAMVGRRIPLGAWALDVEAFYGSWEFVQYDFATYARVDGGYGGQVWIHTPIDGLRVGSAGLRFTVGNLVGFPPTPKTTRWRGSRRFRASSRGSQCARNCSTPPSARRISAITASLSSTSPTGAAGARVKYALLSVSTSF